MPKTDFVPVPWKGWCCENTQRLGGKKDEDEEGDKLASSQLPCGIWIITTLLGKEKGRRFDSEIFSERFRGAKHFRSVKMNLYEFLFPKARSAHTLKVKLNFDKCKRRTRYNGSNNYFLIIE